MMPGINIISGTNGTCKTSLLHMISNAYQAVTKNCDWISDKNCLDIIKQINNIIHFKFLTINLFIFSFISYLLYSLNINIKFDPLFGSLSSFISALFTLAIDFAIASPSPVPPVSLFLDLSTLICCLF